mgnify:CR=1 FL=1
MLIRYTDFSGSSRSPAASASLKTLEKYINGHITRTDLERWILTHSLENEYAKPYSGEPFKINGDTKLQVIDNYTIKNSNQSDVKD